MVTLEKVINYIKSIKELIYIVVFLGGIVGFIIDERVDKATTKMILENHTKELVEIKDQYKDINRKLERNEMYWKKQEGINGSVLTALGLAVY